ncbi:MAG: diversity-generating retroelement protein Avd [Deltaproteobacteria bacterium]|nr:diversity-generating retroelement protein Avd [Deltaproteobacteria bacterium]
MKIVSNNPNGPNSITKTYDLLKWAIPHLKKLPRDQRFLLGDRIEGHLLDILELLLSANYSREKLDFLKKANLKIELLRFLFRLSFDMKYLSKNRYEYASVHLDEVGKMVGGWIRQQRSKDEEIR